MFFFVGSQGSSLFFLFPICQMTYLLQIFCADDVLALIWWLLVRTCDSNCFIAKGRKHKVKGPWALGVSCDWVSCCETFHTFLRDNVMYYIRYLHYLFVLFNSTCFLFFLCTQVQQLLSTMPTTSINHPEGMWLSFWDIIVFDRLGC